MNKAASVKPLADRPSWKALRAHHKRAEINSESCVTYLGPGSAGDSLKMVHNGIGYGIMACCVEGRNILRNGFGGHEEKAAAKEGA